MSLTETQYMALFEAYLDSPTIGEAAAKAGVSYYTAKAAIENGSPTLGFPAIRDRVVSIRRRVAQEQDELLAQERKLSNYIYVNLMSKLRPVVESIEMVPNGHDETVNGKKVRVVDERAYRHVVSSAREVMSLGRELRADAQSNDAMRTAGIQINVNQTSSAQASAITADPVAAREAAHLFMRRHAGLINRVAGTPDESIIVETLAAETRRRNRDDEGEEFDDSDEE